ncbi:MAG: protein kinase [Vulcanimicrobiota bacterium]
MDKVSPAIDLLPPRYEVVKELGRGGMAVVYHAFDTTSKRHVAIKFLPPTDDENALKRFRREAADLAAVFHDNIVDFYAVGEYQGREYIEMEYVDGGGLAAYLRGRTLAEILTVFTGICDGLAHIHNRGIVHRDLKPANVLVTRDGVPKISDLGLARRIEQRSKLTQDGMVLGTCSYLAPEQILSSEVGPAADLYALGVCLFEAVTGHHPFQAENSMAMLRAHLDQKAPLASSIRPGLPPKLDTLLARLLEKEPRRRPATAQQIRTELEACRQTLAAANEATAGSLLVGRQDDLNTWLELLTSGLSETGLGCLLEATSGIGRSAFLEELRVRLVTAGHTVHSLHPGQPLAGLLASLRVDTTHLAEPEQLAGGLRRALQKKHLILVDDFERLDSLSQKVLERLARLTPPTGAGWLISSTRARAYDFVDGPGCLRRNLEALTEGAVVELVERQLGCPPGPELTGWLVPRCAGSPRRAKLYTTLLTASKLLVEGEVPEPAALPARPTELLPALLGSLEEDSLTLLRALCLVDRPLDFGWLQTASELGEDQTDQALERLMTAGLVEEVAGERYQVFDVELREAVTSAISERVLRRRHARLGECLPAGQRGPHLFLAGDAQAFATCLDEGDDFRNRGLLSEALDRYDLAGQALGPADPRPRLGRARTFCRLGEPARVLEELAGLDSPEAQLLRLDAALAMGDLANAYNLCREAEGPELRPRLARVLEGQGHLKEAIATLADPGPVDLAEKLQLARLYLATGQPDPAAALLEPEPDSPSLAQQLERLVCLADLHESRGRNENAQAALRRGIELAAAWPARRASLELRLATLLSGDEARAACERALAELRPAGESRQLAEALVAVGEIYRGLGLRREAADFFRESVEVGDLTDSSDIQARSRLGLGRLRLEDEQSGEAVATLEQAVALAETSGSQVLMAESLAQLATARRREGDTQGGLMSAQQAVALARKADRPAVLGMALVALAEICVDRGMWKSGLDALQEARTLIPSADRSGQVRLNLALAELHRQGSQKEYPGLSLAEAERFEQLAQGLQARETGLLGAQTRKQPGETRAKTVARTQPPPVAVATNGAKLPRWPLALVSLLVLLALGAWAMQPRSGKLEIRCEPAGAVVKLNDTDRHPAPASLELPPGEYKVKFFKKGFKEHFETVNLEAGGTYKIAAKLEPATGTIKLVSKPAGAKLFLAGKPRGVTPLKVGELAPQKYEYSLVKEGYKKKTGTVEVVAGQLQNLELALDKIPPPPPPPAPVYYAPSYSSTPSYSGGRSSYSPPPQPTYRPPPQPSYIPPAPRVEVRLPQVRVSIPNPVGGGRGHGRGRGRGRH